MARTYEEIENDRKLIIKFMELKQIKSGFDSGKYKLFGSIVPYIQLARYYDDDGDEIDYKDVCYDYDFKFHSSWDWLMPVVKKCYETSPLGIALDVEFDKQYEVVMSFIKKHLNYVIVVPK